MTEAELMNGIGSVGFPIIVTMFLLTKGSTLVTNITAAIVEMKNAIVSMQTAVESLTKRLEVIESERVKNNE